MERRSMGAWDRGISDLMDLHSWLAKPLGEADESALERDDIVLYVIVSSRFVRDLIHRSGCAAPMGGIAGRGLGDSKFFLNLSTITITMSLFSELLETRKFDSSSLGAPDAASVGEGIFKMKALLLSLLVILGLASYSNAGEKILPYAAFGPQVAAHELIGMEWWQWQAAGGDEDREYSIKVVVYWGQSREATEKKYPVDESKEQDYRYLEYSQAVKHMENLIKDFKAEKLDTGLMEKHLAELKKSYESDQARSR